MVNATDARTVHTSERRGDVARRARAHGIHDRHKNRHSAKNGNGDGERTDAASAVKRKVTSWRPQRDSNPRFGLESEKRGGSAGRMSCPTIRRMMHSVSSLAAGPDITDYHAKSRSEPTAPAQKPAQFCCGPAHR